MIRRSFPRFDFSTPERSWSLLRGLRRMRLALDRPWTVALWIGVMVTASTLFADGQLTPEKAQEENERADRFFSEARYNDAYDSYDKALITGDADVSLRARQGKIRSSLRLARFHMARYEAELMRTNDPTLANSVLWITGSTSVFREIETINAAADAVPVISAVPEVVQPGLVSAVLSIGISFESNAHLAAVYGADVLQGRAKAGDLKVGIVSPPDIAINFGRARQIGMRVPFSFFEGASFIYDYSGRVVRNGGRAALPAGG